MDKGDLIEIDIWPASEKAELTRLISRSVKSDFNLAYDESASPNKSKEFENGTMSIDTVMSRTVYKTVKDIYKGVGYQEAEARAMTIFSSSKQWGYTYSTTGYLVTRTVTHKRASADFKGRTKGAWPNL